MRLSSAIQFRAPFSTVRFIMVQIPFAVYTNGMIDDAFVSDTNWWVICCICPIQRSSAGLTATKRSFYPFDMADCACLCVGAIHFALLPLGKIDLTLEQQQFPGPTKLPRNAKCNRNSRPCSLDFILEFSRCSVHLKTATNTFARSQAHIECVVKCILVMGFILDWTYIRIFRF